MKKLNYAEARGLLMAILLPRLNDLKIDPATISDDLNIVESGIVDSFNLVEILVEIEAKCEIPLNYSNLSAEDLSSLRALCEFIAGSLA